VNFSHCPNQIQVKSGAESGAESGAKLEKSVAKGKVQAETRFWGSRTVKLILLVTPSHWQRASRTFTCTSLGLNQDLL
jgi:hypothetical protein